MSHRRRSTYTYRSGRKRQLTPAQLRAIHAKGWRGRSRPIVIIEPPDRPEKITTETIKGVKIEAGVEGGLPRFAVKGELGHKTIKEQTRPEPLKKKASKAKA